MKQLYFYSLLLLMLWSCAQMPPDDTKVNGVSFVGSPNAVEQHHIDPVLNVNANYASVMPFGFIRTIDHPEILFNTDRQWYGETREGARQYILKLHLNEIEVMLKPQIWIWHGEFTGNLKMKSEEDWKILEESYRNFIMEYVTLAKELNVAMFCIGTELEQFIMHRTDFWFALIDEIKEVYNGKLTYAANWDEYKRIPFWKELDYIGVDAYFPVSDSQNPTIEEAISAWQPWKDEIQKVAMANNRKVIFAEYGYRSVDFAGKEPWRSDRSMTTINLNAQSDLLQVLIDEVWNEEWFAGGFIWKWYLNHDKAGGIENNRFTPQNKPAETVLREAYSNLK